MDKEAHIKHALEVITQGNLDLVVKAFSEDYLAHAEGKTYRGHKFLKRFTKQLRTAIPDVAVKKVEILVDAGDLLTWQRTMQGTHKANMAGIPASGKQIQWTEMVVSRFVDGLIAEEWVLSTLAEKLLLQQGRPS